MKTRFDSTPDAWIVHAWRKSAEQEQPSAAVDRRILARAQVACHEIERSRWWVWPVSIAAALVVCAGLVMQMMSLMRDDTTMIVMQPSASDPRESLPPQHIGAMAPSEDEAAQSWQGTLADGGVSLIEREPVAAALLETAAARELTQSELTVAQEFLTRSAADGDVASFARLFEVVAVHPQVVSGNLRLSDETLRFAQDHGLTSDLELHGQSAD